jgi:hypothetical protein
MQTYSVDALVQSLIQTDELVEQETTRRIVVVIAPAVIREVVGHRRYRKLFSENIDLRSGMPRSQQDASADAPL